ncbi:right-handed parallel beta-helix repeat-containing protein, partial [Candidatus Pacearchaeota archaeon]|nr:right-handed parallel beta-helix repeat-containing protein [Candidatus Pacearchaeota archaeon]
MVYKRYIYRNGKRFGPYYYHTYRDNDGNTHSKYIEDPKKVGAVTDNHQKKSVFKNHPLLFVLSAAILVIILGVFYLNSYYSQQENLSSGEKASGFERIFDNVKSFVTGFTSEGEPEPSPDASSETSSTETIPETPVEETTESVPDEAPPEETPIEQPTGGVSSLNESVEEEINESANETIAEEPSNETSVEPGINETASNETAENETTGSQIPEEVLESPETAVSNQTSNETIIVNIINETLQNFTIVEQNITNITIINQTANITTIENTIQYGAVLNKLVKWEKKVKIDLDGADSTSDLVIDLPVLAGNVSVKKIKDEKEEKLEVSVKNEKVIDENSPGITGSVTEENEENGFLSKAFSFILGIFGRGITGKVVDVSETSEDVRVEINEPVEDNSEILVEYYTDAPYSEEQEIKGGKKVKIIGPSEIHYENVLVFTELNESLDIKDPNKIKIYWEEQNIYVTPTLINDSNSNGIYDYIEWIVPSLSNQTFNIIVITKAEHLDENRTFISDVYEQVKSLDDVWSETIQNGHYVRATFEHKLDSSRDISVYPRIVNGTPRIEIYEINENEIIAEFENLVSDEYNKVYLTGLVGEQDTFDLKVLDGSVEFDHIIDPQTTVRLDSGNATADVYYTRTLRNSFQMTWNLSAIPSGSTINDATICLREVGGTVQNTDADVNQTRIDNRTWADTTITGAQYTNNDLHPRTNSTTAYNWSSIASSAWWCLNVTNSIIYDYNSNNNYTTIRFEDPDNMPATGGTVTNNTNLLFGPTPIEDSPPTFASREYTTDTSLRPYLNITYTPAATDTPPQWSSNSTNSTGRGTPVEHRVYWTDDTALSGYIFSFTNGSVAFVNDSFVSMIGITNWSNVTKVVNSTNNVTIQWKVFSNDSANQWNSTDTFNYLTNNTSPTHDNPSVIPVSAVDTDDLTCDNRTTVDANKDNVTNIYNWLVNGSSITSVNMPFDTNMSTANSSLTDYSGGSASAFFNGTPVWVKDANMDGGYNVTSNFQFASVSNSSINIGANFTTVFLGRRNTGADALTNGFFRIGAAAKGIESYYATTGQVIIEINNVESITTTQYPPEGQLFMLSMPCNATNCTLYINDSLIGTSSTVPTDPNSGRHLVGSFTGSTNSMSGIMGDFKIYNRTLTQQQISKLWQEANNNLLNSTIVSQETLSGQNWTCQVTPNDQYNDGILKINWTVIADPAPIVTLTSPSDGASIVGNTTVSFLCNASDNNGLVNISLYINSTGTWHLNQTVSASGISDNATFNFTTLGDGTYAWNCLVFDNSPQSSSASANRTVTLDICDITQVSASTTLASSQCEHYNITANNVALDCASYTINGNNSYGILGIDAINRNNVTIKNCKLERYAKAVRFYMTNNSIIQNSTLYNISWTNTSSHVSAYGISLENTYNSTLSDNNLSYFWTNSTSPLTCYTSADAYLYAVYLNNSYNDMINKTIIKDIKGQYYGDANAEAEGCQGGYLNLGHGFISPIGSYNITKFSILSSNLSNFNLFPIRLEHFVNLSINDSRISEGGSTLVSLGTSECCSDSATIYNNQFNSSASSAVIIGGTASSFISGKIILDRNVFSDSAGDALRINDLLPAFVEITNNRFYNASADYISLRVKNASIKNNIIDDSKARLGDNGILLSNNVNITVDNNTIINLSGSGAIGVLLSSSADNLNVSNLTVTNCETGFSVSSADNVKLINSTITNCSVSTITVSSSSNLELYDAVFNKSNVSVSSGFLEVYYQFRANVTDGSLTPISSASLDVRDRYGNLLVNNNLTGADGLTAFSWIMEYNQSGNANYSVGCTGSTSNINCSTPHNATASKTGYSVNMTNVTINISQTLWMPISTPYISAYTPTTDVFSIAEPSNQTFNIAYANASLASVRWYVNGSQQTSYNNLSTFNWTGNYTQQGTYAILVNLTDANGWDSQLWNMTVNDTDTAPTHNNPSILPFPPTSSQNFTCYNQSTADANGDNVTNIYNWLLNGTSLTLLNMPFDTNSSTTAKDYSGFGNNGSVSVTSSSPSWISNGKIGGAYNFSYNGNITIQKSSSLNNTYNFSIDFWI